MTDQWRFREGVDFLDFRETSGRNVPVLSFFTLTCLAERFTMLIRRFCSEQKQAIFHPRGFKL